MSKGSRQRPREIPAEQFQNNWDLIFGKKDKEKPKEDTEKKKDK